MGDWKMVCCEVPLGRDDIMVQQYDDLFFAINKDGVCAVDVTARGAVNGLLLAEEMESKL